MIILSYILVFFLGVIAKSASKDVVDKVKKASSAELIGPEFSKDNSPMKTFTLINSAGDKEYIMTNKNMHDLISELNYLALKENSKSE